jgi:ABC-type molybdate transport system ATPase subunit
LWRSFLDISAQSFESEVLAIRGLSSKGKSGLCHVIHSLR